MKKITFILIALITGTTFAQGSDTGTATVNAEIVSTINISNGTNLDFGRMATPTADTEITVGTDGVRGTVTGVTIPGGTVSAAAFTVNAASGYTYSIAIPTISLTGNGTAMPIIFTHDGGTTATGTGADQTLNVGGTLTVGADQVAGAYTGTVIVTVAYN